MIALFTREQSRRHRARLAARRRPTLEPMEPRRLMSGADPSASAWVVRSNGTLAADVQASETPPVVGLALPLGATVGGPFTGTGSFTDPNPGTFTATVNYGDGGGPQPLTLNANDTFTLAHTYTAPGDYTVVVQVADSGGAVGTASAPVAVVALPPPPTTYTGVLIQPGRRSTSLVLSFGGSLNPQTADSPANFSLVSAGRDKKFGTGDDKTIALAPPQYDPAANTVTLTTRGRLSFSQPLQLTINNLVTPSGTPLLGMPTFVTWRGRTLTTVETGVYQPPYPSPGRR